MDKAIADFYLGTETWRKKMRGLVESKPRSTDHPTGQRAVVRPAMHTVLDCVARASGVTVAISGLGSPGAESSLRFASAEQPS